MSLGLGNDTDVSFPFTFSFTFLPKTWRKRSWPSLHLDHLLCVNVNGGGGFHRIQGVRSRLVKEDQTAGNETH